jgi:hypothetical protein
VDEEELVEETAVGVGAAADVAPPHTLPSGWLIILAVVVHNGIQSTMQKKKKKTNKTNWLGTCVAVWHCVLVCLLSASMEVGSCV